VDDDTAAALIEEDEQDRQGEAPNTRVLSLTWEPAAR
jgi:hypothetical protein